MNLFGRVGEIVNNNVYSWEDCSIMCKKRPGCKYWIWTHALAGEWANQCRTLLDATSKGTDGNCVSGNSKCVGTEQGGTNQPMAHVFT